MGFILFYYEELSIIDFTSENIILPREEFKKFTSEEKALMHFLNEIHSQRKSFEKFLDFFFGR